MRILGIDTAIPTASVALVEDGELLIEEIQAGPGGCDDHRHGPVGNHAAVLLPLLQLLFEKAQIPPNDLSGLSISIGPGSFTGLRIGLATAKGMAYESNLPLVGVSTLHANAARVRNFEGVIGSMVDARKGEVYLAFFCSHQKNITRLTPDAVLSLRSATDLVREYQKDSGSALLIGSGAQAYEIELSESLGPSVRLSTDGDSSVAAQVALLACERFASGAFDDVGTLAPVYLRASEAETKREGFDRFFE